MKIIDRDCGVGFIVSGDHRILLGLKDPGAGGVYVGCWHLDIDPATAALHRIICPA